MAHGLTWETASTSLALGAGALVVKGAVRATEGADLSLVPWLGLGATLGLTMAARQRALVGRWRWLPLLVITLQFPIFIAAGAIGDGLGRDALTDGLGLVMTGLLWMVMAYGFFARRA